MTNTNTTQHEADERAAFETWYDAFEFRRDYDKYGPSEVAFTVWQARAAIDQSTRQAAPEAPAMPGWFTYDDASDTLTIYGIKYAGELLRDFGSVMPAGRPFEIVQRENGVLAVRRLDTNTTGGSEE